MHIKHSGMSFLPALTPCRCAGSTRVPCFFCGGVTRRPIAYTHGRFVFPSIQQITVLVRHAMRRAA